MRSRTIPLRALTAGLAAALLAPAAASAQTKLSGIGDSIMQGANAKLSWWPPPGDQPQFSFVRGSDSTVSSVFRRYRARGLLPAGQQVVSVDGAQMAGGSNSAPAQAQRICGQAVKPDRIVIELGGNDVCSRSSLSTLRSPETFRAALAQALDVLASPSCGLPPGTKVHVLTMPAVNWLYSAGVAKQWSTGTPCQLIWWGASICPLVTMGSGADRAVVAQTVDAYNAAIADAVATAQATYPPDAIQFSTDYTGPMDAAPDTSVGTYRFQARDLSDIDCFHPKWSTGQRKLACAAWESWESTLLGGTGDEAAYFQ